MSRIVSILLLLLVSGAVSSQSAHQISEARAGLTRAGAVWPANTPPYISLRFDQPLAYPGTKPEIIAKAFLSDHNSALALENSDDLALIRSNKGTDGNYYLRYQQNHKGACVLGAELTVAVTPGGSVRGLASTLLPPTFFAPAAAPPNAPMPDDLFRRHATESLQEQYPFAYQWNVEEQAPVWVSPNPWRTSPDAPAHLTRVFEVSEPGDNRRVRVYLDATTAKPVFSHQLHCDLNRRLYNRFVANFNIVWNETDVFPGSLDDEQQEMLVSTAETYNLINRTFGRSSYDGSGGRLNTVTGATFNTNPNDDFGCPNARAGLNSIRHCAGVVTDDVVAHEWMHVYTYGMNGLIYAFESGAINEGFSDIFGECLDLLNDRGNDTNDQQLRTGCDDDNMRWKLAEDATAIDGTLRDFWLPECKDDASSRDSPNFMCASGETDAVHTNSGLVNRAFVLLTDGGIVGQDTIMGIGMTKALHIFYHTNANYVTRVTDFFALGDMLMMSAKDLLGVNLPALTLLDLPAPFSGEVIDSADIAQLAKAILVTQLRGEGPCTFNPALAQNPPSSCATAVFPDLVPIMDESWEDSLGNWTVNETPVIDSTWDAKPWRISGNLPNGRGGLGVFAPNPDVGNCQTDLDNGVVSLTSPPIRLPMGESDFRLVFDHYFALQEELDGGLLYISIDGGDFEIIPNSAFLFNGYNSRLARAGLNDNPLAGKNAFNGSDEGSTSGSWGRSIVDLAKAGAYEEATIRIRWTLGHDGCDGWLGWFLDDVRIGYCGEIVLPVELLDFRATPAKDRVDLDWATARERDNAGFFVERRNAAGGGFRELGFVSANGTGAYNFTDFEVSPGAAYVYRLRQQDRDGAEQYSNLITVRLPTDETLLAYPNPARNILMVSAAAGVAELFDGRGRLAARAVLNDGRGQIATGHLPAGVYFLRVGDAARRVMVVK